MGKPNHHDTNYFTQRIESRHNIDLEDMERCHAEILEVIDGIVKGFALLEKLGKYPDPKVLENKNQFLALELLYRQKIAELKG